MKDRQPTQPGRVKITPENGDAFFAVMEMADEPLEMGTPPIKENLLRDETESALFGSARDRTVNDAFFGIASKLKLISADMASITLTVKSASGNPLSGVIINGAYDENGSALITGSDGTATGYVSEGSVTLSVSGYADIVDYSETFTAAKGQSYTKTITLTTRNFLKITSSKNVKFSGNVTRVDVSSLGGGGAGGSPRSNMDEYSVGSGAGGGGGYANTQENVEFETNREYQAIVGAGGTPSSGSKGGDGGLSSFLGVTANGGKGGESPTGISQSGTSAKGGAGNGNGGNGERIDRNENKVSRATNGTDGTQTCFISFTETAVFGGGGSAPYAGLSSAGDPYGGQYTQAAVGNAKANTGGGGAGGRYGLQSDGDGGFKYGYGALGGKGGSGFVSVRMHLTAA